ncbi:MAG: alpha-hydroxy-acid oxidizing protein [Hyphomicrobiaceae bacterium]|nr:alpha-hydroxy-acid oxidizing protein [Hyphomicrobiaceae bacterium]
MTLDAVQNIEDLRRHCKRRLPKVLFELIESGVEDELSIERNLTAFDAYQILPRYLTDISGRKQSVELFGRTYASPFGLAPTGFAGLMRKDIDLDLAGAAEAGGLPFILSGASIASVERIRPVAKANLWCHLYPAKDGTVIEKQLERYAAACADVLVVTVDNPVFPKRDRDTRNGFSLPLRLPLPIMLEALTHPGWLFDYFRAGGMPMMESWRDYAPKGSNAGAVAGYFRQQSPSDQTWESLNTIRKLWPGKFVVKGIQHPEDAHRCAEEGVDGIIVSNHGGKAFDPLPSPLTVLPHVKARVAGRLAVMFDGGIRRGWHMLVARALGADFMFVARPTLYGAAAFGRAGAEKAIQILKKEIDISLAMTGLNDFADMGPQHLVQTGLPAAPAGSAN